MTNSVSAVQPPRELLPKKTATELLQEAQSAALAAQGTPRPDGDQTEPWRAIGDIIVVGDGGPGELQFRCAFSRAIGRPLWAQADEHMRTLRSMIESAVTETDEYRAHADAQQRYQALTRKHGELFAEKGKLRGEAERGAPLERLKGLAAEQADAERLATILDLALAGSKRAVDAASTALAAAVQRIADREQMAARAEIDKSLSDLAGLFEVAAEQLGAIVVHQRLRRDVTPDWARHMARLLAESIIGGPLPHPVPPSMRPLPPPPAFQPTIGPPTPRPIAPPPHPLLRDAYIGRPTEHTAPAAGAGSAPAAAAAPKKATR